MNGSEVSLTMAVCVLVWDYYESGWVRWAARAWCVAAMLGIIMDLIIKLPSFLANH